MTDIVERLLDNAREWYVLSCPVRAKWDREGAQEIEKLRSMVDLETELPLEV